MKEWNKDKRRLVALRNLEKNRSMWRVSILCRPSLTVEQLHHISYIDDSIMRLRRMKLREDD